MLTCEQISEWGHSSGEYQATAEQLAEWLEWMDRSRFKPCRECPAKFPDGCVDDWETCEVEAARARNWLEGRDE